MGIFDVPASELIEGIAKDIGKEFSIVKPAFTEHVKTGAHVERAPQRDDWYYVRCASILYRLFKEGPLGVGSLRTYYGGRKNRGVKPHEFRKASGKVIRQAMQDLEKAGLIKKDKKGRIVTPKGHKYLAKKSKEVRASLKDKKVVFERKKAEALVAAEKNRALDLKKQEAAEAKKNEKRGKKSRNKEESK